MTKGQKRNIILVFLVLAGFNLFNDVQKFQNVDSSKDVVAYFGNLWFILYIISFSINLIVLYYRKLISADLAKRFKRFSVEFYKFSITLFAGWNLIWNCISFFIVLNLLKSA